MTKAQVLDEKAKHLAQHLLQTEAQVLTTLMEMRGRHLARTEDLRNVGRSAYFLVVHPGYTPLSPGCFVAISLHSILSMDLSKRIRSFSLVLAFITAAPLLACEFDPPGMNHEQWMKWVNERNQKNDEKQAAAEAKPQAKPAGTTERRSFRGESRRVSGDNVIRLRR